MRVHCELHAFELAEPRVRGRGIFHEIIAVCADAGHIPSVLRTGADRDRELPFAEQARRLLIALRPVAVRLVHCEHRTHQVGSLRGGRLHDEPRLGVGDGRRAQIPIRARRAVIHRPGAGIVLHAETLEALVRGVARRRGRLFKAVAALRQAADDERPAPFVVSFDPFLHFRRLRRGAVVGVRAESFGIGHRDRHGQLLVIGEAVRVHVQTEAGPQGSAVSVAAALFIVHGQRQLASASCPSSLLGQRGRTCADIPARRARGVGGLGRVCGLADACLPAA